MSSGENIQYEELSDQQRTIKQLEDLLTAACIAVGCSKPAVPRKSKKQFRWTIVGVLGMLTNKKKEFKCPKKEETAANQLARYNSFRAAQRAKEARQE